MAKSHSLLFFFGLLVCSTTCVAAPVIQVEALFGTTVGPQGRIAVRVDAIFDAPFEGHLLIRQQGHRSPLVARKIHVGAGQFRWEENPQMYPATVMNSRLEVSVVPKRGRAVAYREFALEHAMQEYRGYYQDPTSVLLGVMGGYRALRDSVSIFPKVSLVEVKAKYVPQDWRILNNVHALLVTRRGVDGLDEESIEVLSRWMRAGGVIVVDGSITDQNVTDLLERFWQIRAQGVPELKPVNIDISSQFSNPRMVQNAAGDWVNEDPVQETFKGKVRGRTLTRGSYVASVTQIRKAIHTPFGLGALVLLPSDLVQLASQDPNAAGTLLVEGLNRSGKVLQDDEYGGRWYRNGSAGWGTFMRAFSRLAPISVGAVVLYVLLFIFVAGPIEFILLHRLKKRQWTWVVTPVLVALFCYGANAMSVMTRGTDPYRATVSIADFDLGGRGTDTIFECITSPGSRRAPLRLQRGSQLSIQYGEGASSAPVEVRSSEGVDVSMRAWIPVTYEVRAPHNREAPYSVSLKKTGKKMHIRCVSKSGAPKIKNAKLVTERGIVYALSSNATKDGSVWEYSGKVIKRSNVKKRNAQEQQELTSTFYQANLAYNVDQVKVAESLERLLDWKSVQMGFDVSMNLELYPLRLPMPVVDSSQALLLVTAVGGGPQSDLDWPEESHQESHYLIRQLVRLQPKESHDIRKESN